MSMLPLDFSACFSAFGQNKISVFDTVSCYVNGEWVVQLAPMQYINLDTEPQYILDITPRYIKGIMLSMDNITLDLYADGSSSYGGITCTTSAPLYWTDVNNTGTEQKQSYISYENYIWRCRGKGLTQKSAGLEIYHLTRFFV